LNPIYLDHNATTMMEQSAQRALLLPHFGNPSSVHWAGRKAKAALDDARESIALALGVENPDEILFTGSATESINTALKGFFFHEKSLGRDLRLIISAVEHEATLDTARFLGEQGAEVEILGVSPQGELSLADLKNSLNAARGKSVLVSLMAANNETGVIFPWAEAASLAHEHGALFHLDGVQALGKLPGFSLAGSKVHLASFSAHKIGGPKGVGALVARKGVGLVSLLHGGAQERKRRAGTVNVPGILAFAAAAEALRGRDLNGTSKLRAWLETQVRERIPGAQVQGERAARLVNTSNFLFEGVRGESLLMGLDLEGFAVSSGSACNSGSILPSHVLMAMGFDKLSAQSALRVSLGPENTEEELQLFLAALERVVARIRGSEASRSALRSPANTHPQS
jgi:cysteine desulfurase